MEGGNDGRAGEEVRVCKVGPGGYAEWAMRVLGLYCICAQFSCQQNPPMMILYTLPISPNFLSSNIKKCFRKATLR